MQSKLTETRQSWTYQEDKLLLELIKLHGCTSWNRLAHELQSITKDSSKTRTPAACRERYQNILNPNLNKSNWTDEEEQQLFNLQSTFGNTWARIASLMPGRSDLLCKNYFYATLRKVLRRLSKSIGLDQSSDLLKQIKPSVLGGIYSNDDSFKNFTISEEVKNNYKNMIAKYRHTEKSQLRLLHDDETSHIKSMLNLLFVINNDYITSKKNRKNTKQNLSVLETSKNTLKSQNTATSPKSKELKFESKFISNCIKLDTEDYQRNFTPQILQNQPVDQEANQLNSYIYQAQPISVQSPSLMAFQIQPNLTYWPIQSIQTISPIQYLAYPYPQLSYGYAYMV